MKNILRLTWGVIGFILGITIGILYQQSVKPPPITLSSNSGEVETKEVTQVAQQFVNNRVLRADTLNYDLLSVTMHRFLDDARMPDAKSYSTYMQSADQLDTAEVIGVVLVGQDTARVFVLQTKGTESQIMAYQFVKESNNWKFDNFEFENDI